MTPSELIVRLSAIRGACPVTIETRTVPTMRKTGNPYAGNVVKLSRVNGMVGWHYAASVNAQRVREGGSADFDAVPRKWGERVASTPFVVHNGRVYLELKVERSLGHEYQTVAGQPVPVDALAPFLPAQRPDNGRQGVEREVVLRDYAIDSIAAVTLNGQRHVVGDNVTPAPAVAAA